MNQNDTQTESMNPNQYPRSLPLRKSWGARRIKAELEALEASE